MALTPKEYLIKFSTIYLSQYLTLKAQTHKADLHAQLFTPICGKLQSLRFHRNSRYTLFHC